MLLWSMHESKKKKKLLAHKTICTRNGFGYLSVFNFYFLSQVSFCYYRVIIVGSGFSWVHLFVVPRFVFKFSFLCGFSSSRFKYCSFVILRTSVFFYSIFPQFFGFTLFVLFGDMTFGLGLRLGWFVWSGLGLLFCFCLTSFLVMRKKKKK